MNKSMVIGTVLGAAVATAGGAIAGLSLMKKEPEFAQVVSVEEIKESVKTPRQECHDEQVQTPRQQCHNETVTHQRPVQDNSRVAGSLLGAVVGGALGHQVGGGKGKKAATVLGAAAGGYAGNQIQKGMQQRDTYTTTEERCSTVYDNHSEQRCKTVYDTSENTVGYNVTYVMGDMQGRVRMDHDPGDRIPVKDGMLVLDAKTSVPDMQPVRTVTSVPAAPQG